MLQLRPYQEELIVGARQHFRAGRKRVLIQLPTGGGKTALCARMLHNASSRNKRVWFCVHRRELVKQVAQALSKEGIEYGLVTADAKMNLSAPAQICSIPTLAKRLDRVPPPELIAWDECFPAGTLIDGKPIEDIKCGDMVRCFDHVMNMIVSRPVVRLFSSVPSALVRVRIRERQIICTPGHPFFVYGRGYVSAINLKSGDVLVQDVRHASSGCEQIPKRPARKSRLVVLWERMLGALSSEKILGDNGQYQSKACFRSNEIKQSYASCRLSGKDVEITKSNWTPPLDSRRQRQAINGSTVQVAGRMGVESFAGICFPHVCETWIRLSRALQNRLGRPGYKTGYRNRWCKSFFAAAESTGFQKREPVSFARVDGVEVYKSTDHGEFFGSLPDDRVYNIEVEQHHNYFANGILVHNCHHIAAGSWAAIMAKYPQSYHIGLSATPTRLDGAGLANYFDAMVCGPSVKWLIDQRFLSKYRLFAPTSVDASSLPKRGGEYVTSAAERLITPRIVGDAISHYRKHCDGARAIVFAVSVQKSRETVELFNAAGIPSLHIDAKTEPGLRDAMMADFAAGKVRVISNVNLFSEGFDCPALEAVIDTAPTASMTMYRQRVGRMLRPFDGKEYGVYLDCVGNSHQHGLPDDEIEWQLTTGRAEKKKNEVPAPRVCGYCFGASRAGSRVCRICGAEFPVDARKVEQVDGELAEVDPLQMERRERAITQGMTKDLESLIQLGRIRGMKNPEGWARHVIEARNKKRGKAA